VMDGLRVANRAGLWLQRSLEMPLRIDLCAFLLDIVTEWTLTRPLPKLSG